MAEERFEGNYGTTVALDLCHPCQGLWFDREESLQLSPGATLRLFRAIHEKRPQRRNPLPDALSCPRCQGSLGLTHDMQRTTRFSYFRCLRGDGRFTTFFQFLREKNFVRGLDPKQLDELRRHVRTINCSNCGAAVDLEKGAVCGFCRSPLSILDPEQIEATVRQLQQWEEKRKEIDPTLPAKLVLDRLKVENLYRRHAADFPQLVGFGLFETSLDVVTDLLTGFGER